MVHGLGFLPLYREIYLIIKVSSGGGILWSIETLCCKTVVISNESIQHIRNFPILNATVMQLHWLILLSELAYLPIVLTQASLSLSKWYVFKLQTLLSTKGGLVWQFYYSFCQRQLADETISFTSQILHLHYPGFWEDAVPLSYTFPCSVEPQVEGT